MGDLMMGMMVLGGIGGAIKNNTASAITDTCTSWATSKQQFQKTKQQWSDILTKEGQIEDQANKYGQNLIIQYDQYQAQQKALVEAFKGQELVTFTIILIFVFYICFILLMRYFKVYSKIWNLF